MALFTSCACNRTPNSVHWSSNELIAYGATNGVAVVRKDGGSSMHVETLSALHTDRVNCVRWVERWPRLEQDPKDKPLILSGSVDKSLKLSVYRAEEKKLVVLYSFCDATASLVCCDGMVESGGNLLLLASSGDSYLRVYEPSVDTEKAVQSIRFGTGFILCLHLTVLGPDKVPMMACAGDDMKVHLYSRPQNQFMYMMTLAGHEDWIRCVEFTTDANGDTLLASCAQDCFIRVWRLSNKSSSSTPTIGDDTEELKLKEKIFSLQTRDVGGGPSTYSVSLETILSGHEGWVYGVHWQPPSKLESGETHYPMRLLTASMDKTMIIWEPDSSTGVWEEKLRVGEVGGNTLGLFGCQFSPDGHTILAHGYQGAFTLWNLQQEADTVTWTRGVVVGGHFGEVTDVCWDPKGEFLLSCSNDQTCRLFAPWKDNKWYEMGRPQVHGYDIQCIAMLERFFFASGADEKVIRTFTAPLNFLRNLQHLLNLDLESELASQKEQGDGMAEGASVPVLGLSNKAVFTDKPVNLHEDRDIPPSNNEQYSVSSFRPLTLSAPPSEDNLLQNTLWPETQKLYGHGFEIISLAANPQGTRLASACKASKAEHAGIIIWSVPDWQQVEVLQCHSLTVVQMQFSHSGDRLLSVCRDRTWSIHHFNYHTGSIDLVASTDKKTSIHSRIIWSCSWSHDDLYFITGSRDKKLILWAQNNETETQPLNGYAACSQHVFNYPVTAVDFAPESTRDRYVVAVGLESGEIHVVFWSMDLGLTTLHTFNESEAHHLTVKRLRFRPVLGTAGKKDKTDGSVVQLASCGLDHQVKVYNINLLL